MPFFDTIAECQARPGKFSGPPSTASTTCVGFPSPAEDHLDIGIDLNRSLIQHRAATFFIRAQGQAMEASGIRDGDVLVVDRALNPCDGQVVVAVVDGEFLIRRVAVRSGRLAFYPPDGGLPVAAPPGRTFEIWGVVTYSIHAL